MNYVNIQKKIQPDIVGVYGAFTRAFSGLDLQ